MARSLLLLAGAASAHRSYLDALPNAQAFASDWPAIGHVAATPKHWAGTEGFPRNLFGAAFARANFKWTVELCQADTDGDGKTNGEELGDPACVWRPGMNSTCLDGGCKLSHPGLPAGVDELGEALREQAQRQDAADIVAAENVTQYDLVDNALSLELAIYHNAIIPAIFIRAITWWWNGYRRAPKPSILGMFAATYLLGHVATLVGSHRTYSHHATKPTPLGHQFFNVLTSAAAQGPAAHWALFHRIHHRFCEQELDLHSPGEITTGLPALKGFLWAQGVWFAVPHPHVDSLSEFNMRALIPDLLEDPNIPQSMIWAEYHMVAHIACIVAFWLSCMGIYYAKCALGNVPAKGARERFYDSMVYAGCSGAYYFWVPICLGWQITMLVNSAVHLWGDVPFHDAMSEDCTSKNFASLMFPMLGENWHNNHHGAPGSATTWVEWYQVDFQYLSMLVLEAVGIIEKGSIQIQPPSVPREGYTYADNEQAARALGSMVLLAIVPYWLLTRKGSAQTKAAAAAKPPKGPMKKAKGAKAH